VPARVATGYAVDEAGRQGGSAILIPSGAAHAWPEVYLDGLGWVVTDVHPERTLDLRRRRPTPICSVCWASSPAASSRSRPTAASRQVLEDWLRDLARWTARSVGWWWSRCWCCST
jgi:transglutaminase-like putative cysteine protease